ncbi:protein FAM47E [Amia ocellicauda]|uniref:protein FAM47E n=1 Tax=Amia ocellicauda TaxID=2972642 RepID=UPI003464DD09
MSGTNKLCSPEQSESKHPWYKERLRTKYLKETKNKQQLSGALDGHQWRFLNSGLDDFRDGYPPPVGDENFIHAPKGPRPVVLGDQHSFGSSKQMPRKKFTKTQVCFSKLTPLQQMRREHIAQIEYGLTQHPLALYPHLEDSMPPELFEQVVDLLDPEMHLSSEVGSCALDPDDSDDCTNQWEKCNPTPSASKGNLSTRRSASAMTEDSKLKNPYKWIQTKDDSVEDENNVKMKRLPSPSHDEHLKHVTKEFCDWVASLGGESNNLDQSTLLSLFSSGYECKPPLTVPIHVVELNNVPAELRMTAEDLNTETAASSSRSKAHGKKQKSSYSPAGKIQYGAWYLHPKMWKKRNANEPLEDPNIISEEKQFSMSQPSDKDEELKHLHGTQAFKQFIHNKGLREPKFFQKLFAQEDEKDQTQKNNKLSSNNGPDGFSSDSP